MFITKFLKPNEVNDINTKGMFIKVMNCEGKLRIRATEGVEVLLDTEVRAGFDLQTVRPFSLIQITSEVEQKLEIWVSQHKLSYDALSTKPNKAASFIAEHYGLSQQILPYDPSQSGAKVSLSSSGFWVGGEGVDNQNGIYVAQGAIYNHDSAAPLHAYINDKPDLILDIDTQQSIEVLGDNECRDWVVFDNKMLFKNQANDSKLVNLETGEIKSIAHKYNSACVYDGKVFLTNTSATFKVLDFDGNLIADLENPHAKVLDSATPYGCVESDGGVLISVDFSSGNSEIHYYKDGVFTVRDGVDAALKGASAASKLYRDEIDGRIWVAIGEDWYYSDDELATLSIKIIDQPTGVVDKPVFSNKYVCFTSNTAAKVWVRESGQVIDVGAFVASPKAVAAVGDAILVIKDDKIYISEDNFATYSIAYTHSRVFCDRLYGMFDIVGNELVAWVNDSTENSGLLKFGLTPDLSKPKALFRVLKESF
ncbi:hypothetical protein [Pseudoalteromonas sp. MEBiC 03485]|uniref:hypothetical protein n=1 Tax=Pseudoalteromonas sp. MEBiC 03485 TaxID=2571103 RepID=UPI0010214BEC|nr:hypothetical protein [Pseudoalteromonas sp. MEBiC 03485]RZD19847.1 hypothetical protein EVU92_17150 [Pseudoalteromonas sp. MEBiC 03485]